MAEYGIEATDEHPFHSAVDDAYYTAMVFQRFPDATAALNHHRRRVRWASSGAARRKNRSHGRQELKRPTGSVFGSASLPGVRQKGRVTKAMYAARRKDRPADCPDHGLMYVRVSLRNLEGHLRPGAASRCPMNSTPPMSPPSTCNGRRRWPRKPRRPARRQSHENYRKRPSGRV